MRVRRATANQIFATAELVAAVGSLPPPVGRSEAECREFAERVVERARRIDDELRELGEDVVDFIKTGLD